MNYKEAFERLVEGKSVFREWTYFSLINGELHYKSDWLGNGEWKNIAKDYGNEEDDKAKIIFFSAPLGGFHKNEREFLNQFG